MKELNKKIEILVRAVISVDNKILLCRKKGKDYYFFPGGHVEFGESTEFALEREIKEELGLDIKKSELIGGTEHTFIEDGVDRHEINLFFNVEVDELKTESQEDHLEFFLFDLDQLYQVNVFPVIIKKELPKWFKKRDIFWSSDIN
jgi:8-oxo-dGTP diphosphatase